MGFIRKLFGLPKKGKDAADTQNRQPNILNTPRDGGKDHTRKSTAEPVTAPPWLNGQPSTAKQDDQGSSAPVHTPRGLPADYMMAEGGNMPLPLPSATVPSAAGQLASHQHPYTKPLPQTPQDAGDNLIKREAFGPPKVPPRSSKSSAAASNNRNEAPAITPLHGDEASARHQQQGFQRTDSGGTRSNVPRVLKTQSVSRPSSAHSHTSQAALGVDAAPLTTPRTMGANGFRSQMQECSSTVVCSLGEIDAHCAPRVNAVRQVMSRDVRRKRMSFLPQHLDDDSPTGNDDIPDNLRFENNSPKSQQQQRHLPAAPPAMAAPPSFPAPIPPPSFPAAFFGKSLERTTSSSAPLRGDTGVPAMIPDLQFGDISDLQVDDGTELLRDQSAPPSSMRVCLQAPPLAPPPGPQKWQYGVGDSASSGHSVRNMDDKASCAETETGESSRKTSTYVHALQLDDSAYDDIPVMGTATPSNYVPAGVSAGGYSYALGGAQQAKGGYDAPDMVTGYGYEERPELDKVEAAAAAPPPLLAAPLAAPPAEEAPKGGGLCAGVVAKLNKKTKEWADRYLCLDIKGRELVGNGSEAQGVDFAYVLEVFETADGAAVRSAVERIHVTGADVKFVQGTVFTVKTTPDLNKKAATHFLSTNTTDELRSWLSAFETVPDCSVNWVGQDGASAK